MKKILILITTFVFCLSFLSGCKTTKYNLIWCCNIDKTKRFSFNYTIEKSIFDGNTRTFEVENESNFINCITNLPTYNTKFEQPQVNNNTYIFLQDGEKYACSKIKKNTFKLYCCAMTICDSETKTLYTFPFVPSNNNYVYEKSSSIQINMSWDSCKDFFQNLNDVVIDNTNMTINVPMYENNVSKDKIALTYNDNTISYSI